MPVRLPAAATLIALALLGCDREPHVCTAAAYRGSLSVDVTDGLVDRVLPNAFICVDGDCRAAAAALEGPPEDPTVRVQRDASDLPLGEHVVRLELRRGEQVLLQASGTATVRASAVGTAGCEQQVRRASLRYDAASGSLVGTAG